MRKKHSRFSWAFVWVVLGVMVLGLLCVLPLTNLPPAKPELSALPTVEPSPERKLQRIPDWVFEAREQGFNHPLRQAYIPTPTPLPEPSPEDSPISARELDRRQREAVLWASIGKKGWMDADEEEEEDAIKGPVLRALKRINHERDADLSDKEIVRRQREAPLWAAIGKVGWHDIHSDTELDNFLANPATEPIIRELLAINRERSVDP